MTMRAVDVEAGLAVLQARQAFVQLGRRDDRRARNVARRRRRHRRERAHLRARRGHRLLLHAAMPQVDLRQLAGRRGGGACRAVSGRHLRRRCVLHAGRHRCCGGARPAMGSRRARPCAGTAPSRRLPAPAAAVGAAAGRAPAPRVRSAAAPRLTMRCLGHGRHHVQVASDAG